MVSLEEAELFLSTLFGRGVRNVASMGKGEWSQAYALRREERDFVIRFSLLDEDFQKDRLAMRFASYSLPIPAITELGEAFNGYYAISTRASGSFLDDLDEEAMRAILTSVFATLDAMRLADCSASRGYGIWGGDGNAPWVAWRDFLLDVGNDWPGGRIHGWQTRLVGSPIGSVPFDAALECLRWLAPYLPEERHLIHSDLLNFNVLVDGGRISTVIDWGCAMYGDFLYDLAWFCFWSPWYPAWRAIDFQLEAGHHYATIGLELPNFEERIRACQIHIGLASQAYSAFKGRWGMVAEVAERTRAVATGRH
jgi:hygromycin-B 4-O-kinase